MSRDLRIDFVSPPFAGHLYPAIELASRLQAHGGFQIRVLTTAGGEYAATAAGLPFVEILPGHDAAVWAIADTRLKVGSNPVRMWKQLRHNLALMGELQQQLRAVWEDSPPDLVIADFVVPVAGWTAQNLGIPWWTGMPSPCVVETLDGTPAYLGGWMPRSDAWGRRRDWIGRKTVRTFKRISALAFSSQLKALSMQGLYRSDGSEVVYSPQKILAYGMQEFEFDRTWPRCLQFIGPFVASPPMPAPQKEWNEDRRTVLVTLGTHLTWAKSRAIELLQEVASLMPDTDFHFSRGMMGSTAVEIRGNLHLYDCIRYDAELSRYDAAIIHGGTGITYACIAYGIPMLVWPHDYDQFDHAARIVFHQLGRRLPRSADRVADELRRLWTDRGIQDALERFQSLSLNYHPCQAVLTAIRDESLPAKPSG